MEIKLQCGDTITIPEGCKAIVKNGSVVFEREKKEEAKTQDFNPSLTGKNIFHKFSRCFM